MKTQKIDKIESVTTDTNQCVKCRQYTNDLHEGYCDACWSKIQHFRKQNSLNMFRGLLRERKYRIMRQLNDGIDEWDKSQNFLNTIPRYILENTLDDLNVKIEMAREDLLSVMTAEELDKIEKEI